MNSPEKDAANSAVIEALARPEPRDEVISYFKIDFQRCVIRRGTRMKPSQNGPPRVEAR